jgi:hypothetical protein
MPAMVSEKWWMIGAFVMESNLVSSLEDAMKYCYKDPKTGFWKDSHYNAWNNYMDSNAMEKMTKHRIVGLFVPLIEDGNNTPGRWCICTSMAEWQ